MSRSFIQMPSHLLQNQEQAAAEKHFSVEGVGLQKLLTLVPTPFYVTSLSAVAQRVEAYRKALNAHFELGTVFYAMKANSAPTLLKTILNAGAGLDIVSGGELKAALRAGAKPEKICFAGVGKTTAEIDAAFECGVGILNVEHTAELTRVLDKAYEQNESGKNCILKVALRLNPCVDIATHPHLRTGALDSKFGIFIEHLKEWASEQNKRVSNWQRYLKPLQGVHVHIGSQLQGTEVFNAVILKVLECVDFLHQEGCQIHHLDLGGGLGVGFNGAPADNTDILNHVDFLCNTLKYAITNNSVFFEKIKPIWGTNLEKLSVNLEPGRSVVASSTVLITQVMYEKSNGAGLNFAYVDAGMNDFPRPSIYGAKHFCARISDSNEMKSKKSSEIELLNYSVVGPVCESGDVLAKEMCHEKINVGDILGFFEAGAYCRSMASHYNMRPLPAELFVLQGEAVAISRAIEAIL